MQDLMVQMTEFVSGSSFWVYVFIIFGKILEVTIATVRVVLVTKGQKVVGSFAGVIEYLLWLLITGIALAGIQTDIIKMLCLAGAFGVGIYIGVYIEEKLAFGLSAMNIIVSDDEQCQSVLQKIRDEGFGVTVVEGQGLNAKNHILYIVLNRKAVARVVGIVEDCAPSAVVFVSGMNEMKGGYIRGLRRKTF